MCLQVLFPFQMDVVRTSSIQPGFFQHVVRLLAWQFQENRKCCFLIKVVHFCFFVLFCFFNYTCNEKRIEGTNLNCELKMLSMEYPDNYFFRTKAELSSLTRHLGRPNLNWVSSSSKKRFDVHQIKLVHFKRPFRPTDETSILKVFWEIGSMETSEWKSSFPYSGQH